MQHRPVKIPPPPTGKLAAQALEQPGLEPDPRMRLLDGAFQVEPAGEEIFKGKSYPVKVYSVEC